MACGTAAINFCDLPAEIRLLIYAQLLVSKPSIVLRYHIDARTRQPVIYHWRNPNDRIHPAILRTNKKAFSEGSPVLYSSNRFQFPPNQLDNLGLSSGKSVRNHWNTPLIDPFLSQIGQSRAGLIRHVRIHFPSFSGHQADKLRAGFLECIAVLRENCHNLARLELALELRYEYRTQKWLLPSLSSAGLDILNGHLRTLTSLRDVTVDIRDDYSQEIEANTDQPVFAGMLDSLRRHGWTVKRSWDMLCLRCGLWVDCKAALWDHSDNCPSTLVEESEPCTFDLYD